MLSQVLPEDEIRRNAAVAALTAAAEQKQLEMAAAGMSLQQRAPGSQLGNRNGSMTVQMKPFFQDFFLFIISRCGFVNHSIHNLFYISCSPHLKKMELLVQLVTKPVETATVLEHL